MCSLDNSGEHRKLWLRLRSQRVSNSEKSSMPWRFRESQGTHDLPETSPQVSLLSGLGSQWKHTKIFQLEQTSGKKDIKFTLKRALFDERNTIFIYVMRNVIMACCYSHNGVRLVVNALRSWRLASMTLFKARLITWWRHQMETSSALLAISAGNSPVSGEFPAQRPVTRRFDVFFDLRLNERLRKHSWGWWFETPSPPLWRHINEEK